MHFTPEYFRRTSIPLLTNRKTCSPVGARRHFSRYLKSARLIRLFHNTFTQSSGAPWAGLGYNHDGTSRQYYFCSVRHSARFDDAWVHAHRNYEGRAIILRPSESWYKLDGHLVVVEPRKQVP